MSDDYWGPEAPTVTNERGGKQSALPHRFDLIDTKAMFRLAAVLHDGAEKYGENNWRLIDARDHVNHAIAHLYLWLDDNEDDEHLAHALARVHMAVAREIER